MRTSGTEGFLRSATGIAMLVAIAPPAFAASWTLSQTTSTVVTDGNSVSCPTGSNSYYRSFALSDFGIEEDFLTSRVDFGVERAACDGNGQPLTVTIYSGASLVPLGPVIETETFTIDDQISSSIQRSIVAHVPFASGGFVVEVFSPGAGCTFLIGSNAAPETAPGYIEAPDCAIDQPTPLDVVSSRQVHIVLSVTGETVPEPQRATMILAELATLLALTRLRRSAPDAAHRTARRIRARSTATSTSGSRRQRPTSSAV